MQLLEAAASNCGVNGFVRGICLIGDLELMFLSSLVSI
jgi:hypothetical protein